MNSDKIVITPNDVEWTRDQPMPSMPKVRVPIWWRLLSSLLIFAPPLLIVVCAVNLVGVRKQDATKKYAYAAHYCWLMMSCLIFWMTACFAVLRWKPEALGKESPLSTELTIGALPQLPSETPLSGKEIADELSSLVVVVHSARTSLLPTLPMEQMACGAGAITLANEDGCLVVTSKHVVDALALRSGLGQILGVSLQDGQSAQATVVGLHSTLDLALLWVKRQAGGAAFAQPFRSYKGVEVGEEVFVIGHPQGFNYSISSGLVAQKRGGDLIQVSAPVSPGNSGGPVFDTHGQLIAIVQSVFDKSRSPNAENLNFAVRVDDLLTPGAWELAKLGESGMAAFAETFKSDEE